MLFTLSKLVSWIANPGFLLVLIVIGGLVVSALRRRRSGLWLAWIGALGLLAIALLPVDGWVMAPLENRFPAIRELPPRVDGIIVLGGAIEPILTAAHGMPALNDAAERVTSFVKLARLFPDAKLVFTGGSGSFGGGPPEADAAKQMLGDLGLDTGRVRFEGQSRTTFENAIDSKELVDPKSGEIWVLITSAYHMPRAVGVFRHAGWPVLPYPVGYKTGVRHIAGIGLSLTYLDAALHEWVGLLAYRLLDRTDALFPGP